MVWLATLFYEQRFGQHRSRQLRAQGLFTSYAPVVDPRLAIVVVSRGTDGRAHFPVTVAGRIYHALDGRFGTGATGGAQIATTPTTLIPRPRIDPRAAAAIADEDREADADADGLATTDAVTGNARTTVKSVAMPVSRRPSEIVVQPVAPRANQKTPQTNDGRARRVLTNQP